MKLVFAGTPEFARVALQALHEAGHEITLVLTQPDRPAGRGMNLQASPVKQYALAHGLPLAQPRSLRLDGKYPDEARAADALLRQTPHDAMVVAAYGLILPQSVLDIAPLGCFNIHASLLPRWRGAAPIHRAIEAGDATTGITIMRMDAGLDTGPMLLAESVPILPDDSTATLHDRLAALGGRLIVAALARVSDLTPVAQPEAGATWAAKIDKHEAPLDLRRDAVALANQVRAFDPFPGSTLRFGDVVLKVWRADVVDRPDVDPAAMPGRVVGIAPDGIVIATGAGLLRLRELQKPGGKRLPAAQFLAGFAVHAGDCFQIDSDCSTD